MNTCKCDWCGEHFWSDDPEQGMCPTCKESPVDWVIRERAIRQHLEYLKQKRKEEKK